MRAEAQGVRVCRWTEVVQPMPLDYEWLLEKAGIEHLEVRRERNFIKFAQKTSKNKKFSHWFPKNPAFRITRNILEFREEKAITTHLLLNK